MAFSSVQFLFIFLPLSLAVYWLLPKALRNGALGAFSLLFFAWAGLKGAAILLALAAITWLGGLLLEKLPRKKPLLILLIAAHLAVLAAFKYAGFAARSINALVPDLLPVFAPALPLGISFYVFTAIGYLADVSCGKVAAARSPFRFFVFLAFFGHGPSGPIVRYDQQLPCLDAKAAERQVSLDRFCYGIKRFVLGLAKKAIIAEERKIFKGVSPNVDFYSGFVYDMLGIPMELYTPLFAIARIMGWSAHRIEELLSANKIIRPAYKSLGGTHDYIPRDAR